MKMQCNHRKQSNATQLGDCEPHCCFLNVMRKKTYQLVAKFLTVNAAFKSSAHHKSCFPYFAPYLAADRLGSLFSVTAPPSCRRCSGHLRMAQSNATSPIFCNYPIRFKNCVMSGKQVAGMLNPPLIARQEAVVASPAASEASGEG
jgi:hypothetical protein